MYLWNDGDPGAEVLEPEGDYVTVINNNGPRGRLNDTKQSQSE